VIVTVFVVISHIKAVTTLAWSVNGRALLDLYLSVELCGTFGVTFSWVVAWVSALVLPNTRSSVLLGEWGGAGTVVSLSKVNARVEIDLGSRGVSGWVLSIVHTVLDVDLCVGVALVWLAVAGFPESVTLSMGVMMMIKMMMTRTMKGAGPERV
jgi:hypothetical protein